MHSAQQVSKPSAPPAAAKPVAAAPTISRPPPTWAATPDGESAEAAMQRLSALSARFEKADHFELLGLQRKTATSAEAKRNFFVLAKELHPDTVSDPAQADLRQLKELLFSRINEAAQVLSDDKRRKEYEDELEGKKSSVDVARIFAAEENFQRAEIMIKARKYQEGLDLLDKAISMNDQEAEFYAWRGYAKFLLSRDRKEAYPECAGDCKKAIKMIPKCVPAHLFLGHMSKVVGDMKLAQRCYQEVLEIEPKHTEAQRELRLMGKK
jgi:tetratricopeptide (TPR) repeat protein